MVRSKVFLVLKKELREMFRDKKSLAMMLMIPLMIPLLVIGMSALFNAQMNRDISEYNKIGFSYEMTDYEKEILKDLEMDAVYEETDTLKRMYEEEEIDLYVTREQNHYIIHGKDNDTTSYASMLVESYLNTYKEYLQREYLKDHDMDADVMMGMVTFEEDIIETENFYANYITTYAFLFIIMAITVSATYPATDATAGEKERGTLETLLTFPIRSKDIIVGKFLSVSVSSIITGVISLLLMLISLNIAGGLFEIYEGISLMLTWESILFSCVVILCYSFLISGLCIAIASNAKSFKESQSALTPLTFVSFFPSMVAFMVNVKSSVWLSLVPFLNFTLLFTDITNERIDFLNIVLMLISTIVVISVVLRIIIRQYKSERVLFGG